MRPRGGAGVQVVQMAGWEAMPADLATLVACRRAVGTGAGQDGPGAAGPIAGVIVSISFERMPEGGVPFNQSVSAGTMASVIEMLDDARGGYGRARGRAAACRGRATGRSAAPRRCGSAQELWAAVCWVPSCRSLSLNPPIIHRTAALLATENGVEYVPAAYREGVDTGPAGGVAGLRRRARATVKGVGQRLAVGMTRANRCRSAAPSPDGSARCCPRRERGRPGPTCATGRGRWSRARPAATGAVGTATITGTGHPGYTATRRDHRRGWR